MRSFRSGKYSWAAERRGNQVVLRWGVAGGKEQSRTRAVRNEMEARRLYQRLIEEKLQAGYTEVTPEPASLPPLGRALEAAVVADPDDLAAHMGLADWLSEQPEKPLQARGEFIRVQLTLEDASLSPAQRRKLRRREAELIRQHERDWLGPPLADEFLDGGGLILTENFFERPHEYRGYRRGWLDWLTLPELTEEFANRLARADCLRLLRRLDLEDAEYGDVFPILARGRHLGNLRSLRVGETMEEASLVAFVARLPQLEELDIAASCFDPGRLFSLKTLGNLRTLRVVDAGRYPLRRLANNPSLGRLTRLELLPGLVDEWDDPLIRLADVRVLIHSPHLGALTHLAVQRSDMGDRGVREIVASGILSRLVELDVSYGVITDEGARALAEAPGYAHLTTLDIGVNRLTAAGIAALCRDGLELLAGAQDTPDEDGDYSDRQLYSYGDEFDDDWE